MEPAFESLYKDHDNLRRILYLLEELLINAYRGDSQYYPVMQRILAYIQDYPEHVHHPAEDAMFSVILNKGLGSKKFREDIRTLIRDHSEIERITQNAVYAFEPVLINTDLDITELGTKLTTLISRQRSHLLFEEMRIYPHISEYISSKDWEDVAALMPCQEDPIFGERVRKEYELIFKAL